MGYWWSDDPQEILYLEVSRGEDLGRQLQAPLLTSRGAGLPEYALVSEVRHGNLLIHYDSAEDQIAGVSQVSGVGFLEPIWWAPRGSYARRAGAGPSWCPGIAVPLSRYQPLSTPVTFGQLNERRNEIFDIRSRLQAEHPGKPLFFPWLPYRNGLRNYHAYLAKFPTAMFACLPEVAEAISAANFIPGPVHEPTAAEVAQAELNVASAAGRPRSHRRDQSPDSDRVTRVAVEARALNIARAHYAALGEVAGLSRNSSHDFDVTIDQVDWHVIVSATTGNGAEIVLTRDQVAYAQAHAEVALCLVSNLKVNHDTTGRPTARGGSLRVHHPWRLDTRSLTPLGYRYET